MVEDEKHRAERLGEMMRRFGTKVDARSKSELNKGTARAMSKIRHKMPELQREGIELGCMSFCRDACGETRPCKASNRCLLVPKIKTHGSYS